MSGLRWQPVRSCLAALALTLLAACGGGEGEGAAPGISVGGGTPTPGPSPTPTASTLVLAADGPVTRPGWVTFTAAGGDAVSRVELYRGGELVGSDNTRDFGFRVAYTASANRTDRYEARGFDQSGRQVASTTLDLGVSIGRVIYVAGSGNDAASGLYESAPKRTLQAAHAITQPGDSVLVMNGTYSQTNADANILTISRSGQSDAWIAYIGYPGHKPLLKARNWNAVGVQASYIIVEGLTLEGNRAEITLQQAQAEANNLGNPVTSGNGIGIAPSQDRPEVRPAHVVIRDNEVRDFPGGGIYAKAADYLTIERNRVYRNAWYAPYANSGISIYQPWNSDNSTAVKMIIRQNVAYENYNYIPFYYSDPDPAKRRVTDGNGIIIDDFRNTQRGSTLGIYPGRTLIENNIVFSNGGRGINVYSSNRVDVVNNTSWSNARHPDITSEIAVTDADDVLVLNTILSARSDKLASQISRATGVAFSFNLVFGGTGFAQGSGQNNVTGDPRFVDPAQQDFRLLSGSLAIDAARSLGSPARDIAGARRPRGAGIDIGAFESF
ncbi:right-handed parallel beta-helix repeat-containing protein [Erythrobacter sp. CCH5-A1]|uniref:right-handed parallel beta-helix repeat-containing protein n=2 Tax=Bacteria TaxID=2 RepID=UPI000A650DA6|nr:right-handed parallel beta-helix repeat-containing protein [Erythrobacter sp. CCH5-A1]